MPDHHQTERLPAGVRNFDQLPDDARVRVSVVAPIENVTPSTIWRWVAAGLYPQPEKTGPNTTTWRVGDIRARRRGAGAANPQQAAA